MDVARFVDHPLLSACRREYSAGEFLFKQGESGQSMFLIHSGNVRLFESAGDKPPYTAALVGPGDFLGERIVLNEQPHPRFFSAVAETQVMAVEIGPAEIALMEKEAPYLVKGLLKRSLELAQKRLERANLLIRVLRSSNNEERFLGCLRHITQSLGRNTVAGVEVASLSSNLHMHIDLSPADIAARLTALQAKGILVAKGEDSYLIPDPAKIPMLPS